MATVLVIDGATYARDVVAKFSRRTGEIVPEALLNPGEIIVIDSVPAEAVPDVWLRRRPELPRRSNHPTSPFQRGGGR